MRKGLLFLPFLLLLAGAFVSCEEVEEAGEYDNWRGRNEAYIDSISSVAGENYVTTAEEARSLEVGEMFALKDYIISTDKNPRYIYCQKLVKNPEGEIPLWTETANVFYYGTLINGERFDGNFEGYGALDSHIPYPLKKNPTPFDTTMDCGISDTGLRTGWKAFLQYMAVGERWLIYLPAASAYGVGAGSIPGHSALVFDVVLNEIK